jgi:hypothetical protein
MQQPKGREFPMIKMIFAISLAMSAIGISIADAAAAVETAPPNHKAVANLHDNQEIHEDLIAAQELIAMGCMGTLKIAANASGHYDSASIARIQECADNEGTDIGAKVLDQYQKGEIEKARMPTFMIHYAVLFAKKNNPEAQRTTTAELIKSAREQGRKHYPYQAK